MRLSNMVLMFLMAIPFITFSQEKEKSKSTLFYSSISGGYLFGQSGVFPGALLRSGVSLNNLKLGIGGGYDGYKFKSFPVFTDIRMDFSESKRFFGYVNGGYHIPKGEETFDIWSFPGSEKWKGGLFADAGLGIRFKLGKTNNLLLSSGYNYKKLRHTKTYVSPCLIPPCPENVYTYDYGLNYMNMRLNWEINY